MKPSVWIVILLLSSIAAYIVGRYGKQAVIIPVEIATKEAEAEKIIETAIEAETITIDSRHKVETAIEALGAATKTRIQSGLSIDDLPEPIAVEYSAMQELIRVQSAQLELEIRRGDAWKDAALAYQELSALLTLEQGRLIKSAKSRGFRWGLGTGAVLALAVLL